MSNNSVTLYENPGLDYFKQLVESIKVSGEPGVYSIGNAQKRTGHNDRILCNPCLTGDMKLLTFKGERTFKELAEEEHVAVINKDGFCTLGKVWKSGIKKVIKLTLINGVVIKCTPDHKWKTFDGEFEAKDLLNKKLVPYLLNQTFEKPKEEDCRQVISIEELGEEEVYDFSEPKSNWGIVNGYIVHNCGEILLTDRSVCNLSEANTLFHVNSSNTFDWRKWEETIRLITRIGTRITQVEMSHPIWNKTQKRDRLLGVSLTGLVEAFDKLNWGEEQITEFYKKTNELVNKFANEYHIFLGIPKSLLKTTIKPSGSLSQIPTVSSGIHRPYAPYYLRRIRISKQDPLAKTLKDLGYEPVPENNQGNDLYADECNTWVFTFPIKTNAKINSIDEPALVQLERYKQSMQYYVEHNTSITVSVGEDEWDLIPQWLYDNYDYYIGISFLPRFNPFDADGKVIYPNLPYQTSNKEEYEMLKETLPALNEEKIISLLQQYESHYEENELDSDCNTGSCPIR